MPQVVRTGRAAGAPVQGTGPVVISEVLAAASKASEASDQGDWVELWNRSEKEVSLKGWSLSDDPATPGAFAFPDRLRLAPGARLVIRCLGKGATPGSAPFKLSKKGEVVYLFSPQGEADRMEFPAQNPGYSYGWYAGGLRHLDPTPGEDNRSASE
ncbi:MAG: lamin tail domain-containing protein [Planctomycetota bacterium]